jgi:uncharacterized damage-inducible protein DinB
MELLHHFRRQFLYDSWANREVLRALGDAGREPRSLQLLAHILSAERLWLERIKGQQQSVAVWPDFAIERCKQEMEDMASYWNAYLSQLSPDRFSGAVRYKNSKGEEWTSSLQDILIHVLLHSAYHRGQIASQMRANGKQPAYTDFIHATRQGLTG